MRRIHIFLFVGPFMALLCIYVIAWFYSEPKIGNITALQVAYVNLAAFGMQYPLAILLGAVPAYLVYLFDDRLASTIPLMWRAPLCFVAGYFATYLLVIVPGMSTWIELGFVGATAGIVCSLLAGLLTRHKEAQ